MEGKCTDGSYVHNCLFHLRDDYTNSGPLFEIPADGSKMITRLDGYAIVPKERYEALVELEKSIQGICENLMSRDIGP